MQLIQLALPEDACCSSPAVPAGLLLSCLLLRGAWLTVEGDHQIGAARVLHRRRGRAAVAVSVGVAGGVPKQHTWPGWGGLPPSLIR
jgi:hypothetical protein